MHETISDDSSCPCWRANPTVLHSGGLVSQQSPQNRVALPIWGGNPLFARARAVENQVFVVTSAYTAREAWMRSGVIDYRGDWIALAEEWGDVVVAEVDLDEQALLRE